MIAAVIETLQTAGFDASHLATRQNIHDVSIKSYPLPQARCLEPAAEIVVPVPVTFPHAAPYGFFALTPITRRDGGAWRNVSRAAPYQQGLFFSRKCPAWNPQKHDIITFLAFINQWVAL